VDMYESTNQYSGANIYGDINAKKVLLKI